MSPKYITTNIRFNSELHKKLKLRAAEEGKSLGEVVREATAAYLYTSKVNEKGTELSEDPLFGIVGIGRSGVQDGSDEHDRYLYVDGPEVRKKRGRSR